MKLVQLNSFELLFVPKELSLVLVYRLFLLSVFFPHHF